MKGNAVASYVEECLVEHLIDVAVFSEFDGVSFKEVEAAVGSAYRLAAGKGGCEKVRFLVSRDTSFDMRVEQHRHAIGLAECRGVTYLIAGLHAYDRWNCDPSLRIDLGGKVMADVWNLSESTKCRNIVVIGDFNANPYDPEMVQPNSYNAVLFRDVIERSESCMYAEKRFKRLYNPILHFISEERKTYGSFYFLDSGKPGPIWNCLDQALVSKALAGKVTNLSYPRTVGGKSLMKRVKPDSTVSDHLPLVVTMSE